MTRRELLYTAAAGALFAGGEPASKMAVEGYIFQQHAEALQKPLGDVIQDCLSMSKQAGFHNVELSPAFFSPDIREKCLSLLRTNGLAMPSVYVGGAMHKKEAAAKTTELALAIGDLCAPFGCKAIVNNPDPKKDGSEKSDDELATQADALNRMGKQLAEHGFQLRVHHHTPQLVHNAREWRSILQHTNPEYVHMCVDVDWAYEGGFEPLPFLREVGPRLSEIHVRSANNKIWLEDLEDSDIDYRAVAHYLKTQKLRPLVVVELAYRPATKITRPLKDDLRVSYQYARKIFGLS